MSEQIGYGRASYITVYPSFLQLRCLTSIVNGRHASNGGISTCTLVLHYKPRSGKPSLQTRYRERFQSIGQDLGRGIPKLISWRCSVLA